MSFHEDSFHQREKLSEAKIIGLTEMSARLNIMTKDLGLDMLQSDTIHYEGIKDQLLSIARGTNLIYAILTGSSIKSKLDNDEQIRKTIRKANLPT